VLRMNRVRIAPTVLQGKTEGTRKRGRPSASWLQTACVRSDLSLQRASLLAQDRAKWKEREVIVGAHVRPTRHKVE